MWSKQQINPVKTKITKKPIWPFMTIIANSGVLNNLLNIENKQAQNGDL
jgi:hypothetical protein